MSKVRFAVVPCMILVAAASRLIPYPPNLTSVTAMVLFVGADNIFNECYYENAFLTHGIVGRGGISFKF